jgi:hypothetical protein
VWYILFVILWQFARCGIFCFSFYDCSNGVVYFVFHFITVRTVSYILFFILWLFERCGIFCFSFYNCSKGVVYFVFHLMTILQMSYKMKNKIYHTVRTVIKWQTKYTTLFELSSSENQNIPHSSICHKMKNKYSTPFELSSNVLNNFQTKGIIFTGKVHIFVPKYYIAFQFYTKGIILVRFKYEMEIGEKSFP